MHQEPHALLILDLLQPIKAAIFMCLTTVLFVSWSDYIYNPDYVVDYIIRNKHTLERPWEYMIIWKYAVFVIHVRLYIYKLVDYTTYIEEKKNRPLSSFQC